MNPYIKGIFGVLYILSCLIQLVCGKLNSKNSFNVWLHYDYYI